MSNTTNPPAAPQRAMTPEKGPLRWIVAAVVAAVLVLGFAAFLVVKPTAKRGNGDRRRGRHDARQRQAHRAMGAHLSRPRLKTGNQSEVRGAAVAYAR